VARHPDDKNVNALIYSKSFSSDNYSASSPFKKVGFVRLQEDLYKEFIDNPNKEAFLLMPRYHPMLVKPRTWSHKENNGGYFCMKAQLMRAVSPLQIEILRRSSIDRVVESLDYMGQIAWRINPAVYKVAKELWDKDISIAGIPTRRSIDMPSEKDCMKPIDIINEEKARNVDRKAHVQRAIAEQKEKQALRKEYRNAVALKGKIEKLVKNGKVTEEDFKSELSTISSIVERYKVLEATEREAKSQKVKGLRNMFSISSATDSDKDSQLVPDKYLLKSMQRRVKQKNAEMFSMRRDFEIKLDIIEQYLDDTLYFPHNIDFRGRAYPVPPNFSHMGADLSRGMLLFETRKPLGKEGLRWLKIHLANLCGYNKVNMESRVKWTEDQMEHIRESAANPVDGNRWWATTESPFQVLAACNELVNALESGNPEEYMCSLPIHQDGSCNGLQHYAGLGRDEPGACAVNLVPFDEPQDVYSNVLKMVLNKIKADETGEDEMKATCAKHLSGHVHRKVIKQTVMTSVYGVTPIGARDQVAARLKEEFYHDASAVLTPEQDLQISRSAQYLAGLTLSSLGEMFSSANGIMDWLSACAGIVAEQVRTTYVFIFYFLLVFQ
jgi:DNA-directed RNA polymerase